MIRPKHVQWGGLNCSVVASEAAATNPRLAVVLCHGFGAPGTDLVPLGGELLLASDALADAALFVFPEAPLSLDDQGLPGGRAWWPLDMVRLQAAALRNDFRDLRHESPELLPVAREKLLAMLADLQATTHLPLSRIVLGGFSQGSMLATDVSLRLPESPAALLIYSGALLNEAEWTRLANEHAPLRVIQSHGRADSILPFAAAEWLRDLLTNAGHHVDFLPFDGGHTIRPEALRRTLTLLESLV